MKDLMFIDARRVIGTLILAMALGGAFFFAVDYFSDAPASGLLGASGPGGAEQGPQLVDPRQNLPPEAGENKSGRDFFSEHRLEREKQRSMQVDLLREIINNNNTSPEVRQQAQADWLALTALMEKELSVEKLVISKGFADAILVFNDEIAHVIVKSEGLTQAEALQIADLVASSLKLDLEQVRVIERK